MKNGVPQNVISVNENQKNIYDRHSVKDLFNKRRGGKK